MNNPNNTHIPDYHKIADLLLNRLVITTAAMTLIAAHQDSATGHKILDIADANIKVLEEIKKEIEGTKGA